MAGPAFGADLGPEHGWREGTGLASALGRRTVDNGKQGAGGKGTELTDSHASWGRVMQATHSVGREAQNGEEERGKIQHFGKTLLAEGAAGTLAPPHPGSGPTLSAVPIQTAKKALPKMCQLVLGPHPVQQLSHHLGGSHGEPGMPVLRAAALLSAV